MSFMSDIYLQYFRRMFIFGKGFHVRHVSTISKHINNIVFILVISLCQTYLYSVNNKLYKRGKKLYCRKNMRKKKRVKEKRKKGEKIEKKTEKKKK